MLKDDVDIHGEMADDRLNTLKSELSNTSRASRRIFEQADLTGGVNSGITQASIEKAITSAGEQNSQKHSLPRLLKMHGLLS